MASSKQRGPAGETPARPLARTGSVTQYLRSQDLFGTAQEVVIEHNQREYRLRVTSQGKLILTA